MGPPTVQPTRSKRGRPPEDTKKQDRDKGLYHCDYCHKDLSHVPRIKCAVCPDFDLCLECYSVGAQIPPHANSHAYRVVDNLSFPLFHPEWGADEELLLLEAIDMYGLGNWGPDPLHRNSVGDHVGMKGGPECRAHYHAIYIESDTFPLPKPAPEMAGVDIPKLIQAHRSSGQARMTAPAGGAGGAAAAAAAAMAAKRARLIAAGLPPEQLAWQQPPQVLQQVQQGRAESGLGMEVKVEPVGAGGAPGAAQPLGAGAWHAAAGGPVKAEEGAPAPAPAQEQQQHGGAGGAAPMAVDVKKEEGAPAPQPELGAAGQQQQHGGAAPGPEPPPQQQQVHQQELGEKGRKHAAAAAMHHAAEAHGAQLAAAATAAVAAGEAQPGGTAEAGAEGPHTTTATFGLRLRAASFSAAEESLGPAGPLAGLLGAGAGAGAGPATPGPASSAFAAGAGAAAAAKSPAEGAGAAAIGTSDAQQTGYHVKRNEFDPEYDNEAESIVAELEFSPDDTPEQVASKLRLVEIYNRRLDERDRRKAFVLERGLLNVRRQQAADRRRTAAERELQARLRVFARYLPQEQFDALAEGMAVEARLRARIAELCDFRRNGLRTFEQVDEVEALLGEGAAGGRRKAEAEKPPPTAKTKPQRDPLDEGALQSELLRLGLPHAAASLDALRTTLAEGKGTSAALQAWRARRGALLDITSLPDAEPLSQRERALCASERYLPAQYLAVKAALLKFQEAKGHVSRADVRGLPFQVDPARLLRLLDFMAQQGWVRQVAGPGGMQQQQQQQH